MKILLSFLCCLPLWTLSQTPVIYSPQSLYNSSGSLYDIDSLRSLHIQFYDSNYHQILDNAYYNNPDFRLPAQLRMGTITLDSVAIRYKGNSTYIKSTSLVKKPYNIDMNEIVSGQKLMAYKKLKLSNAWYDPTFLKELMAARIYQRYLPAEEVNLMKVYTQGIYLGLYVNAEAINKQFLKKHFDEKSGALFKCDPNRFGSKPIDPNLAYLGADSSLYIDGYDLKSDGGWAALVELMRVLSMDPANLPNVLNIDRVLWYFAVNKAILNRDTYNMGLLHNYYLYQTRDSLFQIIPWDLSESFVGAFWQGAGIYQDDPFYDNKLTPKAHPLMYALLDDPLYRKVYAAHLRTIVEESLDTTWFRSEITRLQALASSAVSADTEKGYSNQAFFDNITQAAPLDLKTTAAPFLPVIAGRKSFLQNHAELSLTPPSITQVQASGSYITAEVTNTNQVELMATTSPHNSKFQSFAMQDDGLNGDVMAGDGIYTAAIPFQSMSSQVKFYIRAHNNDAIQLSPARAEYEFYLWGTGVNLADEMAADHLLIFPNPTRDFIQIDHHLRESTPYEIISPLGKCVGKGLLHPSDQRIDLSGFPAQWYVLKIGKRSLKVLKIN